MHTNTHTHISGAAVKIMFMAIDRCSYIKRSQNFHKQFIELYLKILCWMRYIQSKQ